MFRLLLLLCPSFASTREPQDIGSGKDQEDKSWFSFFPQSPSQHCQQPPKPASVTWRNTCKDLCEIHADISAREAKAASLAAKQAAGKTRREEREAAHAIDCATRAAVAASSKAEFEASIAEAQAAIAYIVALVKSTRASSDEEGAAPATVRSPARAVMSDTGAAVAASMSPAPTAACNETSAVEAVQAASFYAGSAAHHEESAAVVASTEAGARQPTAAENRAALEAWLYAAQEARREEAAALATARSATARAMSDPGASRSEVLKAALETSADEAAQADLFEAKLAAGRDAALAAHREEKKAAVLASVGAVGEARHALVDAASMPDVQAAAAS